MRTGRALTVPGVGASQKNFFWGKKIKIEKKRKKNWKMPPPEKLETPTRQTRTPLLGTRPVPPPVDRQMLVKILPWPNFVAAGKYDYSDTSGCKGGTLVSGQIQDSL